MGTSTAMNRSFRKVVRVSEEESLAEVAPRMPRPCPCVLCRDRAGILTSCLLHPQKVKNHPVAKGATRMGHPLVPYRLNLFRRDCFPDPNLRHTPSHHDR